MEPLTPPSELPLYKRSVSFDLPEQEKDSSRLPLPCVNISAVGLPSDVIVALSDRHAEMRSMANYPPNREFFESIRHRINTRWPTFEAILYTPRSTMPDREWIALIKATLNAPELFGRFKDLVGYTDDEDQSRHPPEDWFAGVTLSCLRDYPERVAALGTSYPQFFANCKNELEDAAGFTALLCASREDMGDKAWEDAIHHQLDRKPTLFKQLQEIVAYEAGYDP